VDKNYQYEIDATDTQTLPDGTTQTYVVTYDFNGSIFIQGTSVLPPVVTTTTACPGVDVMKWSQGGAFAWANDPYDHEDGSFMYQKGCLVTALAIGMEFACDEANGSGKASWPSPQLDCANLNPRDVNDFLTTPYPDTQPGFSYYNNNFNADPTVAVSQYSGGRLALDDLGLSARSPMTQSDEVDAVLCGTGGSPPHPVLVKVQSYDDPADYGHFLLLTGKQGSTYTVQDPGCANRTTLTGTFSCPSRADPGRMLTFDGNYIPYGAVKDPPDMRLVNLALPANGWLRVVDPSGNVTALDTSQQDATLSGIPSSAYFLVSVDDDENLSAPPAATSHFVDLRTPVPGVYVVTVNGTANGQATLGISSFDSFGQPLSQSVLASQAEPGSLQTYLLTLNSDGSSSAVSLPGDRNGDGKVDCSDVAIVLTALGTHAGQTGFNPTADVNADGKVDSSDLAAFLGQIAPPVITPPSASANSIWPPNKRMVPVSVNYSTSDACNMPVSCSLSVASNESGSGEWQIVDSHDVLLKADRNGNGNGRTYTITVTCADPAGNSSQQAVTVRVPHDQGN
jgi:hypothetical protein